MRQILTYAACLLILVLPSCQLTAAQRAAGAASIEAAYAAGDMTAAQRDAAIDALNGFGVDWKEILMTGGTILATILLGTPIAERRAVSRVQKLRGPVATPTERVARAAAAQVKEATS